MRFTAEETRPLPAARVVCAQPVAIFSDQSVDESLAER
jgi:hypothetical protein